jgi:hypothetical protein
MPAERVHASPWDVEHRDQTPLHTISPSETSQPVASCLQNHTICVPIDTKRKYWQDNDTPHFHLDRSPVLTRAVRD